MKIATLLLIGCLSFAWTTTCSAQKPPRIRIESTWKKFQKIIKDYNHPKSDVDWSKIKLELPEIKLDDDLRWLNFESTPSFQEDPIVVFENQYEKYEKSVVQEAQSLFGLNENRKDKAEVVQLMEETLSELQQFIERATYLGEEYISDFPDLYSSPSNTGYLEEQTRQIRVFEKKFRGEAADERWQVDDARLLLVGTKALEKEIAYLNDLAVVLGYRSLNEYFLKRGILLDQEHPYFLAKKRAGREDLYQAYHQLNEHLAYLGYEDLAAVGHRHQLDATSLVYGSEIEKLLVREREACEELLAILGYDELADFQHATLDHTEWGVNATTQEKLIQEQQAVKHQLQQLGFASPDVSQAVVAYRKVKGNIKQYRAILQQEYEQGIWYSQAGKAYPAFELDVKKNDQAEKELTIRCIEIPEHPNTFVRTDLDGDSPIEVTIEQIQNNYARRVLSDELKLVSLVDDLTTEEQLARFKQKQVKVKFNQSETQFKKNLKRKIKKQKGKSIFILGHVEGQDFIAKLATRTTCRISIPELANWGEEYQVNIFAFGCNTARITTGGTVDYLNSVNDGVRLLEAIHEGRTVGEVLQHYTNDTRKILVDGTTFQDRHYLRVKAIRVGSGTGGALLVSGIIYTVYNNDKE